jgi:MGT family glycosyltransferase
MPSLVDMGVVPFQDPGARRFLFVVPPLPGHVGPTVALGAELTDRGHQVAWAGHPNSVTALLEPGARLLPTRDKRFTARLARAREAWLNLRGPAALRFWWEDFIVPLGHGMVPGVEAAVDEFRPDVIISDQQTPAGALVARLRGLPWVTLAGSSAAFAPALPELPRADGWVVSQLAEFQRVYGLKDLMDLRFSDHLVLGFSAAALIGDTERFPDHFAFVGPVRGRRSAVAALPSDPMSALPSDLPSERPDEPAPRVLVSMGVQHGPAEERFYRVAADAAAELDLRAVFVGPAGGFGAPPPNLSACAQIPPMELLTGLSAVVTSGDHDTVCEALAHGLPLVVAPIRGEQPVIARQLAAAGAGLTVRFRRVQVEELRQALTAVLSEEAHRDAARQIQSCLTTAGGVAEAADRLEKLS